MAFQNGFKLDLHVSFKSEQEACCLDLLRKAQQTEINRFPQMFSLHLRFSDDANLAKRQRWNEGYIKKHLGVGQGSQKPARVFICGRELMNQQLAEMIASEVPDLQSKI